ncbi:MAG: hypothetical protein ABR929_14320 [Roseiarcus sp.]|jgi:uncharacterized protein YraI
MRRLIVTFGLCVGLVAPVFADPARTTAPVVMRAAPTPKARVVQNIPANAEIDLSHCSGDWCYASWRDRFGYVEADAVAAAPYAAAPPGYYGPYDYGPAVGPWWGWGRPYYYGYGWGHRW